MGASLLVFIAAAYVATGLVVSIAFVLFGVTRALSHPVEVTPGARILFIPAAFALWPLVLVRWLKAGRAR